MHEIVLSATAFCIIAVLAFAARRHIASIHLLALALFFPLMPIARLIFDAPPRHASDTELIFLYSSVLLYAIVFFLISFNSKALAFSRFSDWIHGLSGSKIIRIAIMVFVSVWCLRLYSWVVYGVAVSGSGTTERILEIPYWFSVLFSIGDLFSYGAFLALAVFAFVARSKLAAIFILLELAWVLLADGRREFLLYIVVLLVVAHQVGGFSYKRIAFLSFIGIVFIWVVTPVFISFRDLNNEKLSMGYQPVEASLSAARRVFSACVDGLDCGVGYGENLVERPNVLEFLREVISARQEGFSPTHGMASVVAISWAVPSVLVEKPELMTEQFIQSEFGMALSDTSSSALTLAYSDFGLLGIIALAATYALFFSALLRLAKATTSRFFGACVYFSVLSMMWNVEVDPTAHVVLVRDIALISISIWIFSVARLGRKVNLFPRASR